MNTAQRIQLEMQLTLRNCIAQNEAEAKKIPKFWENYLIVKSATDEIQIIGKSQTANKTGIASDKNKLKRNLIVLAAKYSRKVAAYAKYINSDTLLKEVEYNEGQLERLAEIKLIERAMTIHKNAEANIDKLAEQGITPDTQKTFMETIVSLNNILKTPRANIAERKKVTERLAVLFKTAGTGLDMMDYAVGSVKDEQVDFYNAYKTARKIVDSNTGNVALRATAVDSTNNKPLDRAIFTFVSDGQKPEDGEKQIVIKKKTASKGGFHIRNMKPGAYKVAVRRDGYKVKEVTVDISEGKRKDLKVELEKA
jgi:hypothetical protein